MTAKTTATRAEAIAAAVARYAGDDFLIHWDQSEYIEGVCQSIADTFGVNDPQNARSEVWEELRAAFEHNNRRAEAERIAREHAAPFEHETDPRGGDLYGPILEALTAAVLAGMQEQSA